MSRSLISCLLLIVSQTVTAHLNPSECLSLTRRTKSRLSRIVCLEATMLSLFSGAFLFRLLGNESTEQTRRRLSIYRRSGFQKEIIDCL